MNFRSVPLRGAFASIASVILLAAGCSLVVEVDECDTDRDCRQWADEPDALFCNRGLCEERDGWSCDEDGHCSPTDDEAEADSGQAE